MITINKIRHIIQDSMEDASTPQAVLNVLQMHDGKPLTKRIVEPLNKATGLDDIRICRHYGMTSIEWGGYSRHQGRKGGSMLVAHSEKNVVIDCEKIKELNPCYFYASSERNEKRESLLNDGKIGNALSRFAVVANEFNEVKARLEEMFEYGQPLGVVNYRLQELIDWKT